MTERAIAFALTGTTQAEPVPQILKAGKLTAQLIAGNLRALAYDGIEVLRGISYLVRDRDWGTYDPALCDLAVTEDASGFAVTYTARCDGPGGTVLSLSAAIAGRSDGTLTFTGEASSMTGFETNRCGFCILHPIIGLAGAPVTVEHTDGRSEETQLPDLIDPWQPFQDVRAITHTVMPGVTAECRMEGDTFEMEDQRNWSDASYKTYVRPLARPWPYRIAPGGKPVVQRIVLRINDARPASPAIGRKERAEAVRLTTGDRTGTMPSIGLAVTPAETAATMSALTAAGGLLAQDLLLHFDPTAGHGRDALAGYSALAAVHTGSLTLEIALACERPPDRELNAIASTMQDVRLAVDAIVVSPSVDRQSTPPGSAWPDCPPLADVYASARMAFPGVRLGGGMLSYFTELNRKRVPADPLDFISHATSPIVHAADDTSVMQTLEAVPFITRSVRSIYGDKPYRIGPSTLAMRQNPYGSRTMDNGQNRRIAMAATDPRHNGLFGAAFALGYAARAIEADPEQLTLSALTGPFGLIAGMGEPVAAGGYRPLFHVVRGLAALAGQRWRICVSSAPEKVLAIAIEGAAGERMLWLANITATDQAVLVGGADGRSWRCEMLDRTLSPRSFTDETVVLPPYGIAQLRPGR